MLSKKNLNLKAQLVDFDKKIKNGESSEVFYNCKNLNSSTIPRELLVDYCDIARRIGRPSLIIRWLRPIIRSEVPISPPVSYYEQSMYVQGLIRLGGFNEANKIIKSISQNQNITIDDNIYFLKASFFINQWDYKRAIPCLKKVLKSQRISYYNKLVSRLNLCASFAAIDNYIKAEKEIDSFEKILNFTKNRGKFNLLLGNLYEIKGQVYLNTSRFDKALNSFQKSLELLNRADGRGVINAEKWQTIIKIKNSKNDHDLQASIQVLLGLRTKAINLEYWEAVREIDFQIAYETNNVELFWKVYWSSRFISYKSRIYKLFNSKIDLKATDQNKKNFIWFSDFKYNKGIPTIDFSKLTNSKIIKRIFFCFTLDFYRPIRIIEVFDLIYSNEYYNPITSPMKVYKLIAKARIILIKNKIPIAINRTKFGFKLDFLSPVNILLTNRMLTNSHNTFNLIDDHLINLKHFTFKDYQNHFNYSPRTARRKLDILIKEKLITKLKFRSNPTFIPTVKLKKNF